MTMIANFNIGLLGHVDSGKTTIARTLSAISSTAAFDKNPQSQERGITLDLGFSGLLLEAPTVVKAKAPHVEQLQITFVDCPGHASLIRTIIGGAQIIDLMLLVVDARKGIQTQTAECIVIGELLQKRLIVVINKVDLLEQQTKEIQLMKLTKKLQRTLALTSFGAKIPIYQVSALYGDNVKELLEGICEAYEGPQRCIASEPLLMYIDHCFSIKGQGQVCTGTITKGSVAVHDTIEFPALGVQRKVKSIQMFRRPVKHAHMGDRVGLCVTQFDAKLLERGVLAQPGYLQPVYAICVCLKRIPYYKHIVKSKSKFHISVGHDTVMARVTLFYTKQENGTLNHGFDCTKEYEYLEELSSNKDMDSEIIYALLEFERAVLTTANANLIASKLDMDVHTNSCRLAFWGSINWLTHNPNYAREELTQWRVFKRKQKQGYVDRIVNEREVIVQNLFKKMANRNMYVGKVVELSTGERGYIESTFGQTTKVRICFNEDIMSATQKMLATGKPNEVFVLLKFKKNIYNKELGLFQ